ncbi:Hypothetical protein A7982_01248 [Minicystis rosea]|nr:Hypothetical protein A7982_01248 [Minicystis rosea]
MRDRSVVGDRVVVFLGPSLDKNTAREILDADYRPPARKGDFYRLLGSDVETAVLIDGVFHGEPAVWQREILAAIDEGITVFGASSMGALRAAELHTLGMIGHGTAFAWYRDGVIDGDDEVALRHASEEFGYRALSEPLVNIRRTLQKAALDGCLTRDEADALVAYAKEIHYPERSYARLLAAAESCGIQRATVAALQRYIASHRVDVKRQDAIGVLERCASAPRTIGRTPVAYDKALAFVSARLAYRSFPTARGAVSGDELLRILSSRPERWAGLREEIVTRWFLLHWARARGIACPAEVVARFVGRWENEHGVTDRRAFLRANGLTESELQALLEERALADWLVASGPAAFGLDGAAGAESFVAAWAHEHGVAHAGDGERAIAARVVAAEPRAFGYPLAPEIAALQEIQCTGRVAELGLQEVA